MYDSAAFLYSVTHKQKFRVKPNKVGNALRDYANCGPCFGFNDLHIVDNCDINQSHSNFGYSFNLPIRPKLKYGQNDT